MSSTTETGIIKNIENLGDLISEITSMGTDYQPTNALITKAALITKKTACETAEYNVGIGLIAYKNAVNPREINYEKMDSLSTRILGAFKSCGTSPNLIKDAVGLKKSIVGNRIGKEPETPEEAHSVSHRSFDQRMKNFALLVGLVASEPKYTPNEADLKVPALTTYVSSLRPMNKAVDDALSNLNHLRDLRDKELYAPVTGVYDLSKAVKEYAKSVVGATSSVYKRIAKIKFTDKKVYKKRTKKSKTKKGETPKGE